MQIPYSLEVALRLSLLQLLRLVSRRSTINDLPSDALHSPVIFGYAFEEPHMSVTYRFGTRNVPQRVCV